MKWLLISSVLLLILVFLIYHTYDSMNALPSLEISPKEARQQRFGQIVDVRSPKERETLGYYPHSIPLSFEHVEEIPVPRTTSILVYANGDERAKKAALALYDLGYHRVRYLSTTYLSLMPGSS